MFVIDKFIIKMFSTLNHTLSIILISPVKKSSCLSQERNIHILSSVYKQTQSKTVEKYIFLLIINDKSQQEINFFSGGSVIMDYGLVFCPEV